MGRSRISKNVETPAAAEQAALEQGKAEVAEQPQTNAPGQAANGVVHSNGTGHRKLSCPKGLSRKKFSEEAKELVIEVMGVTFKLNKKMFSTGSFGWFDQKNVPATICGVEGAHIHMQFNFTVVGSKEAAAE